MGTRYSTDTEEELFEQLLDEGPLPRSAFPSAIPIPIRALTARFRVLGNGRNSNGQGVSAPAKLVMYVPEFHTPAKVLDAWFEVNGDYVRRLDALTLRHRILQSAPSSWKEELRRALEQRGIATGRDTRRTGADA